MFQWGFCALYICQGHFIPNGTLSCNWYKTTPSRSFSRTYSQEYPYDVLLTCDMSSLHTIFISWMLCNHNRTSTHSNITVKEVVIWKVFEWFLFCFWSLCTWYFSYFNRLCLCALSHVQCGQILLHTAHSQSYQNCQILNGKKTCQIGCKLCFEAVVKHFLEQILL